MSAIYLIVQNSEREDIDGILTSLVSQVPKTARSIFRNTCKLIKKYMDLFTNGNPPKSITIEEVKNWSSTERKVSSSPPQVKIEDTSKLNEFLISINNLVNRQCQTLLKTL